MAADVYVALASTTLTSTANSVTFSSIPSTYTDLVIVGVGQGYTSSSYGQLQLFFNGDTGTNYSQTRVQEFGGTASSNAQTGWANGFPTSWLDWGVPNQHVGMSIINVMNYANTTTYKTVLSRGFTPGFKTELSVLLWRNTAAITTINVAVNDTPMNISTIFSLYGIKAA